jgi:hypothetical protein
MPFENPENTEHGCECSLRQEQPPAREGDQELRERHFPSGPDGKQLGSPAKSHNAKSATSAACSVIK